MPRKVKRRGDPHIYPIEGIMGLLSKKWVILIVGTLGEKTLRYNEIMDALNDISPKTLSDRLKDLIEAGLVERRAYAEIPPRVEYTLTPRGKSLMRALHPLFTWAQKQDHQ